MKNIISAYCSSSKCVGIPSDLIRPSLYVKKENINKGKISCPDCGYALLWVKKDGRSFNRKKIERKETDA